MRARGGDRAAWTATRLLLTGVVVAAGWGALIALMLTLAPDAQVKGMLFWLIGDCRRPRMSGRRCSRSPSRVGSRCRSRATSMCSSRGEEAPRRWAWRCRASRSLLYVLAARRDGRRGNDRRQRRLRRARRAARAAARLGNDQRLLLPASALAGGTLLALADTLARSVAAPMQLPVGVITALIGVPVFLYLLATGSAR